MIARRARIIALWSVSVAAALWIVARADYISDLSAFLPATPTPVQQLLVDQLRDGPASRLILIALENGDAARRAAVCVAMAQRLRRDDAFADIENGGEVSADRDRDFLFRHRYLLSDAVTPGHFSVDGLRTAIAETIEGLASPAGMMLKSLVPQDPTGELLRIVERLAQHAGPRTRDGVWVSADGARTLLLAQTVAAGSDTDAQERAQAAVRTAFDGAVAALSAPSVMATATAQVPATATATAIQLRMSGPGVFAVTARTRIKTAATRLSLISSLLVVGVLLTVYRSLTALALGLLPVATGALFGVAAVALGFGAVHGITLGFGITLIGESVDYSIYFFIQSLRNAAGGAWRHTLWPTIRLGMFTSVCGFASLLPSGFPGLAQLGLYSISGLIAAGLVTRFVLPELLPHGFRIRDVAPLGRRIATLRNSIRRAGGRVLWGGALLLAALALLILSLHHATLWNRELSSLSPVSAADLRYDAELRADLGTADVLDLVIVSGSGLEAVLQGAERAGVVLQQLIDARVIGDFDTPAAYLPSAETQQARRAALPDGPALRDRLQSATTGLDLDSDRLAPFIEDVDRARRGGLVTAEALRGTSLAAGFAALILHRADRWSAVLPLHAPAPQNAAPGGAAPDRPAPADATPAPDAAAQPAIDLSRVRGALESAQLTDTRVLDLKTESDALYGSYLREAIHLSLAGFLLIVVLLATTLRSTARVVRVLTPLLLAVLCVAAGLVSCGQQLTILHLVGMLLIVAVGSNYALFFDREGTPAHDEVASLTLASLALANLSTVIGFGLLSFSQVPVLVALGTTVGPGACLALLFSAVMTSRQPAVDRHA